MIWRIQSRSVFSDLRNDGQRVRSGSLRLTFCPQDAPHPMVAFAFGRKFGNAVERNRARRRLRAAFCDAWRRTPGPQGAFLFTGSRSVLDIDYDDLVAAVARCLAKLGPGSQSAIGARL